MPTATTASRLRQALAEAGLAERPRLQMEEGRYSGFLEMHIEQGTDARERRPPDRRRDRHRRDLAVPHHLRGQQDHAGGTTMAERRDAGLAAVRLLAWLDAGVPAPLRPAHGLDLRPHRADAGRAPASSPARPRCCSSSATFDRTCSTGSTRVLRRGGAGEQPRASAAEATLEVMSQSKPALCDDGAAGRAAPRRPSCCAGPLAAHAERRRARRAIHGAARSRRRCCSCRSIGGISHHWAEDTATRTWRWACAC